MARRDDEPSLSGEWRSYQESKLPQSGLTREQGTKSKERRLPPGEKGRIAGFSIRSEQLSANNQHQEPTTNN
ncbi:hypothetical protein [Daejeonella lutea]|uniref:hypothetical protein n=1 Tax=Daejeonella lutea TaxID=572036 RepID=UPI001115C2BA|nr:hypothetical protein [Daejeonella lutea]